MAINTKIEYLYRDADNYKVWNFCVIPGVVSKEQQKQIFDCLDEGQYFIPNRVGLPEKKFDDFDPQADHPWFELHEDAFTPISADPDVNITAEQLTKAFVEHKDNWQPEMIFMPKKLSLIDMISSAMGKTEPAEKTHHMNEKAQGPDR